MSFKLKLDDLEIEIETVYHKKNNIKLGVYKDLQVKVFCRKDTPDGIIHSFILNKKDWIIKHFKKFQSKKEIEDIKYTDNSPFRYLGKEYTLRFIDRAENYIDIYEEFVIIASNKHITKEIAKAALTGWLSNKAKELFPGIIDKYLKELAGYGLSINSLTIRPMTTRWGTCNKAKKAITLNAYLMQEPMPFIEYVVLHELCHLKHANHSERFYNFVSEFMPDWRERRKMRSRNIEEE